MERQQKQRNRTKFNQTSEKTHEIVRIQRRTQTNQHFYSFSRINQEINENINKTKKTTQTYEKEFEFNAGEYDAVIAFFVKRGFKRASAESTAYVILAQAKIDNIKSQDIQC